MGIFWDYQRKTSAILWEIRRLSDLDVLWVSTKCNTIGSESAGTAEKLTSGTDQQRSQFLIDERNAFCPLDYDGSEETRQVRSICSQRLLSRILQVSLSFRQGYSKLENLDMLEMSH